MLTEEGGAGGYEHGKTAFEFLIFIPWNLHLLLSAECIYFCFSHSDTRFVYFNLFSYSTLSIHPVPACLFLCFVPVLCGA